MPITGARNKKRSSCPPEFMSPISAQPTPKKRVLSHQITSPQPNDDMAPPTIFRVTSRSVNLSEALTMTGSNTEDRNAMHGCLSLPGKAFSLMKSPSLGQGNGQADVAASATRSIRDWVSADENYTPTQIHRKDSFQGLTCAKPAAPSKSRGVALDDLNDISSLFGIKSTKQGW